MINVVYYINCNLLLIFININVNFFHVQMQVHVTARSRGFISTWFQDLAGNKPLTILGKKVS